MQRRDLPEIEDYAQCPAWLRDAMTGYLEVMLRVFRPYSVAAPVLLRLLSESEENTVLDLASGAGGPWPTLLEQLSRNAELEVHLTLSDLHPNQQASERLERLPRVTYLRRPVSVLDVPAALGHLRTLFTGLHHFRPEGVRSIMLSAQEARVPFLAAEATHRSVRGLLVTLSIPLFVLLLMPWVRPLRVLPLLFTYLVPILPVLIWWDGFASALRTYQARELRLMAAELEAPDYSWSVEEVRFGPAPIPVTLLVGRPTNLAP
jgi:hypothetical protein